MFDRTHCVDKGKGPYKDIKLEAVAVSFVILLKFSSIGGIGNVEF